MQPFSCMAQVLQTWHMTWHQGPNPIGTSSQPIVKLPRTEGGWNWVDWGQHGRNEPKRGLGWWQSLPPNPEQLSCGQGSLVLCPLNCKGTAGGGPNWHCHLRLDPNPLPASPALHQAAQLCIRNFTGADLSSWWVADNKYPLPLNGITTSSSLTLAIVQATWPVSFSTGYT